MHFPNMKKLRGRSGGILLMKFIQKHSESFMPGKKSEKRHQELLKEKKEMEENRPHRIDEMRRWKHSMGKILQELELY